MKITKKDISSINMENLSGKDLEVACIKLFSNLGWIVKKKQTVTFEKSIFKPDIILSDGNKDYGYVEIITSMDPVALLKKKEEIQIILDKCKPELFILTNGMIFDVFYNGKFIGSQTIPPSIDTMRRNIRFMAYYNVFMKINKKNKDEK